MENEEEEKKHKLAVFWARFISWALFACLAPVGFIAWRFQLFSKVSAVQFGGWGILAVIIIAVFLITIFKYVCKGMMRWSMTKQIIMGLCKVTIPLIALYWILWAISANITIFLQALAVVIVCETIAIPVNPLPQWVDEKTQGMINSPVDYFFKKYDERNEKEAKK